MSSNSVCPVTLYYTYDKRREERIRNLKRKLMLLLKVYKLSDLTPSLFLNKTDSCHLFDHIMATLMLENGADIRYIQAMLGHVKLDTTQIYTQVSIQKLKDIHTATHPAKNKQSSNELSNQSPSDNETKH